MQARKVKTKTNLKLESSKMWKTKKTTPIKVWFVGRFIRCVENLVIVGWSIGI